MAILYGQYETYIIIQYKGGHGLLIGGYNEFSEYAKLYYGIEHDLESERVKEIVAENKLTNIKKENEILKAKASIKPLVLAFVSPFTSLAYHVSKYIIIYIYIVFAKVT